MGGSDCRSPRRWLAAGAALLLVVGLAAPAAAASATANLSVSATVIATCTIQDATLNFGNYDPLSAVATDGSATLTYRCTRGTSPTIGLALGGNASGTTRRMKDAGTNYLTYELYKEGTRINVWGNSGTDLVSPGATASSGNQSVSVYGRVTASQDVPAGTYTDTVVATINF
jgi:spore coat protein U-like protein